MQGWWFVSFLKDSDASVIDDKNFRRLLKRTLDFWSKRASLADQRWWLMGPESTDLEGWTSERAGESLLADFDDPRESYAPQDQTVQNVLFVGDGESERTRRFFATAAQGLRLKWVTSFPQKTLRIYGLLSLPHAPSTNLLPFLAMLSTQEAEGVVAYRVWDALSIVQGVNQTHGHPTGYPLLTTSEDRAALMAACAFHLAVGPNEALGQLAQTNRGPTAMGVCGLFLDWEKLRFDRAKELAERLGARLGANAPPARQDVAVAESTAGEVAGRWSSNGLMKGLVNHSQRPRFFFPLAVWQQAKDEKGRPISPWAFARRALLQVYFQRHLHTLPFRVSEYAKVFRQASLQRFQEFLGTWKDKVLHAEEEPGGLLPAVDGQVSKILRGEAGPPSLAQVVAFCEKVEASAAPDQSGAGAESGAAELFDVDQQLRPFYQRAPRFLSHDREKALYANLADGIQVHPVPGALFLRAAVLGVVLAAGTPLMLELFRPLLPGLRHLLPHAGWIALFMGLLPLCAAALEYHFWVLKDLRKRLCEYIAAVVRHIQEEAGLRGQKAIQEIRAEVARHAKEIRERAQELCLSWPVWLEGDFKETLFLQELFSVHQIPPHGAEYRVVPPPLSVMTSSERKVWDALNDEDADLLLGTLLEDQKQVPQQLVGYLAGEGSAAEVGASVGASLHAFCSERIPEPSGLQAESQIAQNDGIRTFLKDMGWPSVSVDGAMNPSWEIKAASPDGPAAPLSAAGVAIRPGGITSLAGFMPLDLHSLQTGAGTEIAAPAAAVNEAGALVAGWTLVNSHDTETGLVSPSGEWMPVPEEYRQKAAEARNRFRPSLAPPVSSEAKGPVSAPDANDENF